MAPRPQPPTAIGERIAAARRSSRLTQAALGEATALDRTAVSKIESGTRAVRSEELSRIAAAVGRPVEWFFADPAAWQANPLRTLRRKRALVFRLGRKYGVRSIRVFGSAARGEAAAGSDIDLLVEMEPGRSLLDQAGLLVELEDLLGRNVDVVTVEGLRERIRERVLREAVPL